MKQLILLLSLLALLSSLELIAQDTTLIISETSASAAVTQKSSRNNYFRVNSGELYLFITELQPSTYTFKIYKSIDNGDSWSLESTAPVFGALDYQVRCAAVLEPDDCTFHVAWEASTGSGATAIALYATYDRCTGTWSAVEQIAPSFANVTSQNITFYESGGNYLPVISYMIDGPWRSYINYQVAPGIWAYPTTSLPPQSSAYDFFAGHAMHVLPGNILVLVGRVRTSPGCPIGFSNNMYYRKYDLNAGSWVGPETLLHPDTGNDPAHFTTSDGSFYVTYLSNLDSVCANQRGLYVSRLDPTGTSWQTWFIDYLTAGPTSPWVGLSGILQYNKTLTAVNDTLHVVYADGGENYSNIYTSKWTGSGFTAPEVVWNDPPGAFRFLKGLQGESCCLQFVMVDRLTYPGSLWSFADCEISASTNEVFQCFGDSVVLTAIGGSADWWWSNESDPTDTIATGSNLVVSVDSNTTLIANGDCYETVAFEIVVSGLGSLELGEDTTICPESSLTLDASVSTGDWTYSWSNGSVGPTAAADLGLNSVVATDSNGCILTDEIVVSSFPVAEVFGFTDTTACRGTLLELGPFPQLSSYTWLDGSTDPVFADFAPGIFGLTGFDLNGCAVDESISVSEEICEVWLEIPTAFTPNNDGTNDALTVFHSGINSFELSIFNRWGELIYFSEDLSASWDGTYLGKKSEMGTYVWMAKFSNRDGEEGIKKGTVTIIY